MGEEDRKEALKARGLAFHFQWQPRGDADPVEWLSLLLYLEEGVRVMLLVLAKTGNTC